MFLKYRRTPNKLTIFFCWIIKLLIRQVSTNLNTKYFTIYCNRNLLKEWVRMHAETCWHLHNQLFIQQNPFTQHSAKIVHRYVYERVDACAISSSEVISREWDCTSCLPVCPITNNKCWEWDLLSRCVYTYEEFVILTEAPQCNRTRHR